MNRIFKMPKGWKRLNLFFSLIISAILVVLWMQDYNKPQEAAIAAVLFFFILFNILYLLLIRVFLWLKDGFSEK